MPIPTGITSSRSSGPPVYRGLAASSYPRRVFSQKHSLPCHFIVQPPGLKSNNQKPLPRWRQISALTQIKSQNHVIRKRHYALVLLPLAAGPNYYFVKEGDIEILVISAATPRGSLDQMTLEARVHSLNSSREGYD